MLLGTITYCHDKNLSQSQTKPRSIASSYRPWSEIVHYKVNRLPSGTQPQYCPLSPPPQLPSQPSSQSLRLSGPTDKKSHRASRLSKRHSHDDMLLLPPQLGVSPSPCCLLDDSLSSASDTLASRRHRRIPKVQYKTLQAVGMNLFCP